MEGSAKKDGPGGDLSVTALYTSETWRWAGFAGADLLSMKDARVVFRVTNFVLAVYRLFRWGAEDLRASLVFRHQTIDNLCQRFLSSVEGHPFIVELAAGFSARGIRLSANEDVSVLEVDLPHVIETKRQLLEGQAEGRAVLTRSGYSLVGADLRTDGLGSIRPGGRPTVVIAEGLLMYFEPPDRLRFLAQVRDVLGDCTNGRFLFDLTPPSEKDPPGMIGRFLGYLMRQFTGGAGFVEQPESRADIIQDVEKAGFSKISIWDGENIPRQLGVGLPPRRSEVVIFECEP